MPDNTDHKAIVLKEIEKTKKLIKDYRELTQPIEPDDAYGRISRMDAINNKSVMDASLRQAENKLKNLEEGHKLKIQSYPITHCHHKTRNGRIH